MCIQMDTFGEIEQLISELYNIIKDYKYSDYDNLFTSISDTFYRENFHSDILCYLFKFDETKKELIEWFNRDLNLKIDFNKYKGGDVQREKGHRDITLFSNDKSRVIIIENKSNDAEDRTKQIWNYVNTLESCKQSQTLVDGILYINKSEEKSPEHSDWEHEYKSIENKILITKLLGDKSIESLVQKVVNKSNTNQKLVVFATELIDLFKIIVMGSIYNELSAMYNLINKSQVKDQFLTILESLKEFPKLFTAKYIDDIKRIASNYNVRKTSIWSNGVRNVIYIAFEKYTIDIEFYEIYYDISIVKEGNINSTPIIDKLKSKTKEWPFNQKKSHNGITNRYRTMRKNAFYKEELLESVKKVLDAFGLNKSSLS